MQNRFEGDAHSLAMVGGDVHGDINYNVQVRTTPKRYCLLPPLSDHFTDHESPLRQLDGKFARRTGRPIVVIVRGGPGSGRTTLAVHWVRLHRDDYPDGQFFVRLGGGLQDDDRLTAAIKDLLLATGDFHPRDLPDSLEGRSAMWRTWTEGKRIALVVDEAVQASQVRALLPGDGDSAVLITEARPLAKLSAFTRYEEVNIDPMDAQASLELLTRIAGAEVVAAEPEAVQQLIAVCRGATIALCVVGTMLADADTDRPAGRLARRLGQPKRALRELSKDDELSVTGVLDAAYDRMDRLTQRIYGVLGVHPGTEAVSAQAVGAALDEHADDVEDGFRNLVHARLVSRADEHRVLMAGLVREHAEAKAGEPVLEALIRFYRSRAAAAARLVNVRRSWNRLLPDDQFFDDRESALAWLENEHPNLCAIVHEAARRPDGGRSVAELAVALWALHERGGYAADMVEVNRKAVAAAVHLGDPVLQAVLRTQLGFAYRQRGMYDAGVEAFRAAGDDARRAGEPEAEATALEGLGLLLLDGEPAAATDVLRENLALALRIADDRRLALARLHLAKALEAAEALPLLDLARAHFEQYATERGNVVKTDLWRGRKLLEAGRPAEARTVLTGLTGRDIAHRERGEAWLALADGATAEGEDPLTYLREAGAVFTQYGFRREAELVAARTAGRTAEG